jgi:hypothetical protein
MGPTDHIAGIGQHAAKAQSGSDGTVGLLNRDLRLPPIVLKGSGALALAIRATSLVQLSGRKRRRLSMIGTSPDATVTDTRVWQFAFLPSAVPYCGATPTEAFPFLGSAVSSMISQALSPPTSSSACCHKVASQRSAIPQTCSDEMMQPIIGDSIRVGRHGLDTLPIAWPN